MSREIERMVTENNTLEAQNNRSKGAYDCYVCMEKTSDSRKQAALIPCGHTVCEECAPQVQGQPCPECFPSLSSLINTD